MVTPNDWKKLQAAADIEMEAANEAGALGFMVRSLALATIPHSDPKADYYVRQNGHLTLSLAAPKPGAGLPYGNIPRLLTVWMATEATLTKRRDLVLGRTLSAFMGTLGMTTRSGGKTGNITRLREQMRRLFSCSVSATYSDESTDKGMGFHLASSYDLWWNPRKPEDPVLWESTIRLSEEFYREIIERPIPVDMRALAALRRSPMQIDLYLWLTYRLSYLKQETVLPWELLQLQFGANYTRERDFRSRFEKALGAVQAVYPHARVRVEKDGLVMAPSPTHVPRLRG